MNAAEPFDCAICGRRIGKTASHYAIGPGPVTEDQIICSKHVGDTRHLHGQFHPDCPVGWHDLHDHPTVAGTRAGLRWAIRSGYLMGGAT